MRTFITLALSLVSFTGLQAQLPVSREPHHKVVLQNSYLRLLEGKIRENDTTPLHRHAANSVVIFLSPSTFGIGIPGGQPVMTTVKPGDTKYAAYGDKPVDHTVWNATPGWLHFYVVELPGPGLRDIHPHREPCPNLNLAGLTFRWQQPRVVDYDLDISESEAVRLPGTRCARLLVLISGSLSVDNQRLFPNQFKFISPNHSSDLIGAGHCVLLELP